MGKKFNLKKLYNGSNEKNVTYQKFVPILDWQGKQIGQRRIEYTVEYPCKAPRIKHEFKPCDGGINSYQMWCPHCGYAPISKLIGIRHGDPCKNVKHIGPFKGSAAWEVDFANKKLV